MSLVLYSSNPHNIQSLRIELLKIVKAAPESGPTVKQSKLDDFQILRATYEFLNIGAVRHDSLRPLVEDIYSYLSLPWDEETVITLDDKQIASESVYRQIISRITNQPWVFICNVANNSESEIYRDIEGKEYGFNENVTTWQGLVASGSGSIIIFYNTFYNKNNPKAYTAIATVDEIVESTSTNIASLREWRLVLRDYEKLIPVESTQIDIAKRNSQNGIQAVTFATLEKIASLGMSKRYPTQGPIGALKGPTNDWGTDPSQKDSLNFDVTFFSEDTLQILNLVTHLLEGHEFNSSAVPEAFICQLSLASILSIPGLQRHKALTAYLEIRSIFPKWHSVDDVDFAKLYRQMSTKIESKSKNCDEFYENKAMMEEFYESLSLEALGCQTTNAEAKGRQRLVGELMAVSKEIANPELPGSLRHMLDELSYVRSEIRHSDPDKNALSLSLNLLNASLISSRILPFTNWARLPNSIPHEFLRKNGMSWEAFYFWHLRTYAGYRCSQMTIDELTTFFSTRDFRQLAVRALLKSAAEEKWLFEDWEAITQVCRSELIEIFQLLQSQNQSLVHRRKSKSSGSANVPLYIESLKCADGFLGGKTLESIGQDHGLTREAVRLRLSRLGISAKSAKKAGRESTKNRERLEEELNEKTIIDFVRTHPGCLISEIIEFTKLPEDKVRSGVNRIRWLVLDHEAKYGNSIQESTEASRSRAINSLKLAATLAFPLTGAAYDELLNEGYFEGPTRMRIMQVFGTWKAACEFAEVEAGEAPRKDYARTWSEEELVEIIAEYLTDENSPGSSSSFDKWRKAHERCEEIPSFGTVRNQLSHSWVECRSRALLSLRSTWFQGDK